MNRESSGKLFNRHMRSWVHLNCYDLEQSTEYIHALLFVYVYMCVYTTVCRYVCVCVSVCVYMCTCVEARSQCLVPSFHLMF